MFGKKQSNTTSAAYTSEFRHEFKVETSRLIRRRFLWFTGTLSGLAILAIVLQIVTALTVQSQGTKINIEPETFNDWRWWVMTIGMTALFPLGFVYAWVYKPRDAVLLKLAMGIVVFDGLVHLLVIRLAIPGYVGLGGFFVRHFVACLFLPWSAWQALVPAAIVLGLNAIVTLTIDKPIWKGDVPVDTWLGLVFSPLLALPGVALSASRSSRRMENFKHRFITNKYSEMRRELMDARKIHESLFPTPIDDGEVRFSFYYEPMRQIGGDYLYARRLEPHNPRSPVSVVLLDVTGHGIPAALTVNRLHGELERVFAEHPQIDPGTVLELLNRYVHLTLANHSIFVTAFCVHVDPLASTLRYASGGHPPAFVRAVDGTIEELESTAMVLGACGADIFQANPQTVRFGPGDTLLAYTDGAIEAVGESGKMFRIDGLRRLVATADRSCPNRWPEHFGQQVTDYRDGPPADDTLFLTLHRPIETLSRDTVEEVDELVDVLE